MKKMKTQYKMATKATHKTGDISRKIPDLCVVQKEDAENYIGQWVTGFGFVGVRFPKDTTRDLTPEEVEEWHGKMMYMGSSPWFAINLKDEQFEKAIRLTKQGEEETRFGTLLAPLKEGRSLVMIKGDGSTYTTSTIKKIEGNSLFTQNSTYLIEYVD